jgi:hypothetical protein
VSTDGNIWSLASTFPGLFPTPTERKVRAAPTAASPERRPTLAETFEDDSVFQLEGDSNDAESAADQEWHYIRNGTSQGPVLLSELRRLAAVGQLSPQDYVWADGLPDWSPAAKIPQLFPPSAATAVAQASGGITYATSPATQTSSAAIASLVLGLLGITFLPLIGSVLAIVFGHVASKEIDRSQGTISGRAMAIVGLVLGYLVVGAAVVAAVVIFVLIVIAAALAAHH